MCDCCVFVFFPVNGLEVLSHHAAIWLLRERELFGSAFALVRPLYDIMFRALWIGAKATEEQVEQASRDELFFVIMEAKRESDEIRALLRQYFKDFAGRLHTGA